MKKSLVLITLLFSALSYAEVTKFSCTIKADDENRVEVKPHMEDQQTGFFEFIDGSFTDSHIKISYYPGLETVILKVYDKNSNKTYLKNSSPARSGKHNLVVQEDKGIFGNKDLKKIEIDCDLKP